MNDRVIILRRFGLGFWWVSWTLNKGLEGTLWNEGVVVTRRDEGVGNWWTEEGIPPTLWNEGVRGSNSPEKGFLRKAPADVVITA